MNAHAGKTLGCVGVAALLMGRFPPTSGVLTVNKPEGPTSHDIVAIVRKAFCTRRVGHLGTLDPTASGLLLVLVGDATRFAPFADEMEKEYVAEVVLGVQTDTYDREGRITGEHNTQHLTGTLIEEALKKFVGELKQVPPAFSAVSSGGKRHYELARAGKEVPAKPRTVYVKDVELLELQAAAEVASLDEWLGTRSAGKLAARLRIVCSGGTYVRSLAADIGSALGTCGALGGLVRTRIGSFTLQEAGTVEALKAGRLPELLGPEVVLAALSPVALHSSQLGILQQGRPVILADGFPTERIADPTCRRRFLVRVCDETGALAGIGEITDNGSLRPVRMMPVR